MSALNRFSDASHLRVAIIASRWNEFIVKALLEGALETLEVAGVEEPMVVHVAGAWEIPVVAKAMLTGAKPDAIIALGCILQGQTDHAKMLANDVSGALMRMQTEYGVPISWGILTPETPEQAIDRAGLKHGNKGREAAAAALETAMIVRKFSDQ